MSAPGLTGYVLAGGRSSRMGQDKGLLALGGKRLLEIAVDKLRTVCQEVFVLGANPAYEAFAPLVADPHPGCGPLSGVEAALAHNAGAWSLMLPVDTPFLPAELLQTWVRAVLGAEPAGARLSLFTVAGRPQPAVLLVHRDLLPAVREAVAAGRCGLYGVLEQAGRDLADRLRVPTARCLLHIDSAGVWEALLGGPAPSEAELERWFRNLNTPREFADARDGIPWVGNR